MLEERCIFSFFVRRETSNWNFLGTTSCTDIQERSVIDVDGVEDDDAIGSERRAPLDVYGSEVEGTHDNISRCISRSYNIKWKNHFSEMKGDVGMLHHEKEGNKKMPIPRQEIIDNPIPTSLFMYYATVLLCVGTGGAI